MTFRHLGGGVVPDAHDAGLLEQRDEGNRRMNRLMRDEFDRRFPGLLDLVLDDPPAT
jgi:hypothetical protein